MSTFTHHPSELPITQTLAGLKRHTSLGRSKIRPNTLERINADAEPANLLDLDIGAMAAACGIGALLTLAIALGL